MTRRVSRKRTSADVAASAGVRANNSNSGERRATAAAAVESAAEADSPRPIRAQRTSRRRTAVQQEQEEDADELSDSDSGDDLNAAMRQSHSPSHPSAVSLHPLDLPVILSRPPSDITVISDVPPTPQRRPPPRRRAQQQQSQQQRRSAVRRATAQPRPQSAAVHAAAPPQHVSDDTDSVRSIDESRLLAALSPAPASVASSQRNVRPAASAASAASPSDPLQPRLDAALAEARRTGAQADCRLSREQESLLLAELRREEEELEAMEPPHATPKLNRVLRVLHASPFRDAHIEFHSEPRRSFFPTPGQSESGLLLSVHSLRGVALRIDTSEAATGRGMLARTGLYIADAADPHRSRMLPLYSQSLGYGVGELTHKTAADLKRQLNLIDQIVADKQWIDQLDCELYDGLAC